MIASNNQLGSLPILPDSLQILYVFNNRLVQFPTLSAALTELRATKNPSLANLHVAQLSLLPPEGVVSLTETNIIHEDLARLHTQIAYLKGPHITPRPELPQPATSFIDATLWLLDHLSELPAKLQQRALERILVAPLDELTEVDLKQLRALLPSPSQLPVGLHAIQALIGKRIDNVEQFRAEEKRRVRDEYFLHWDAWARLEEGSGAMVVEAVGSLKKWFDDHQLDQTLALQGLFLSSLPQRLPLTISVASKNLSSKFF